MAVMGTTWREMADDGDFAVPDEVVDLSFRIRCARLPADHAWALYRALAGVLPWLGEEPRAAVHSIFDAASGNGWVRPAATTGELMQLSKRTRLYLRLPKHRLTDAAALSGHTLDVGGHLLAVGDHTIRPLSAWPTILARAVVGGADDGDGVDDDEAAFSRSVAARLAAMHIRPPKLLCGLSHCIARDGAPLKVRSVLLANLKLDHSVRLQQTGLSGMSGLGGLGDLKLGCGIFLPHKSIAAVSGSAGGA